MRYNCEALHSHGENRSEYLVGEILILEKVYMCERVQNTVGPEFEKEIKFS